MAEETILVVEDDENILELITFHLNKAGFDVHQTFTGEEALQRVSCMRPDLMLLDLMLPKMSGLEVCTKLKGDASTRAIPIVIVSARGADTDIVAGLEAGADDYITKPFRPAALIEEVKAMLKRAGRSRPRIDQDLIWPHIEIRPADQGVQSSGAPLTLSETEFKVLHFLARHAGDTRTRGQIQAALGYSDEETCPVDDWVGHLCKALGDAGACIESVRRIGYRFKDPHA